MDYGDERHIAPRATFLLALFLSTTSLWVRPAQAVWRNLAGPVDRVADFAISSDSQFVVYTAEETATAPVELFSVPLAGGMPKKLNPPLVAQGGVDQFRITPDGASVVYTAIQDTANRRELYVVPIAGGQATKLNGPLVAGGDVNVFVLDPATKRALYLADQDTNETVELYSVPFAGGSAVKLNPPLVAGGNVFSNSLRVDPSTKRAVYLADQEVNGRTELFSVPATGGTSTKLNADGTVVTSGSFEIDPGVPVLVFQARNVGSDQSGLFSNAVVGGLFNTLSFPLAANQSVFGFRISPDGAHVVYNVVTDSAMIPGFPQLGVLYSVLIGGVTSTLITDSADPEFGTFGAQFQFTPDSSRVVYVFQRNDSSLRRLDSSGLDGSHTTLFFPTSGNAAAGFVLSPDSNWVVFADDTQSLSSIPPTGGSSTRLGTGRDSAISPDSSRVLFETLGGNNSDLISEQIFGGDLRNLTKARDSEFATDFEFTPDRASIVFEFQLSDGSIQLRVSDGTEAQEPTTTTTTLPTGGSTTTLPGGTPTTTTLPPSRQEVCDNCIDDDGNGLTDLEDAACCGTNGLLKINVATIRGTKRSGTRVALKATLADASLLPSAGTLTDAHVQIGPPGGRPLLCAELPAASLALKKARLRFRDKTNAVASARGLDQLTLARKKKGGASLVLGGNGVAFAVPPPGTLRIAIETQAGRCAAAEATFAPSRKGLHVR